MRAIAWESLWGRRWLGRLVSLLLIFAIVNLAINNVFGLIMGDSLDGIAAQMREAGDVQGVIAVLSDGAHARTLAFAAVFNLLFSFLYTGLYSYSMAAATLKAVDGAYDMKGVFHSFRIPIGVWWQAVLTCLVTYWPLIAYYAFLWGLDEFAGLRVSLSGAGCGSMMVGVLCLVRFYRFRMAWFVKAENEDYGAAKCLVESARITHGAKLRNLAFDCSYWATFLVVAALALLFLFAAGASGDGARFFGILVSGFAIIAAGVFAKLYMNVGQAVFYRELEVEKNEKKEFE